jgi:hypothetical protein
MRRSEPGTADDRACPAERLQRLLRGPHLAEKQLNDAFIKDRERAELCDRVSQVYHDPYGVDCSSSGSR